MAAESIAPLWISLGSLLVSGVALGWNIYRDAIDRGKIRLSCYFGMIGRPGVGVVADNILVWTATNVGRQPIMVSQIGGRRRKKPQHWVVMAAEGDRLPKMLQPGEYYSGWAKDFRGIDSEITDLWVNDTLGRKYRAPSKQVEKVVEQLREKRAKGEIAGIDGKVQQQEA
jgi:hypothetical protein